MNLYTCFVAMKTMDDKDIRTDLTMLFNNQSKKKYSH